MRSRWKSQGPSWCTLLGCHVPSLLKPPFYHVGKLTSFFQINKAHQNSRRMGLYGSKIVVKEKWVMRETLGRYRRNTVIVVIFKSVKSCHPEQNFIHLGYLLTYFKTQHVKGIHALGSSTLDFWPPGFLLGLTFTYLFAENRVL